MSTKKVSSRRDHSDQVDEDDSVVVDSHINAYEVHEVLVGCPKERWDCENNKSCISARRSSKVIILG